MALTGFPNDIEVVLGSAWPDSGGINGLNAGEVLHLIKVAGPNRWTEDGTLVANASTNRLKFGPGHFFDGSSYNYAGVGITAADTGSNWAFVGNHTDYLYTSTSVPYNFGGVFNHTWGTYEGRENWTTGVGNGFLDTAGPYAAIFSSISQYAAGPGTAANYHYRRRRI